MDGVLIRYIIQQEDLIDDQFNCYRIFNDEPSRVKRISYYLSPFMAIVNRTIILMKTNLLSSLHLGRQSYA